MFEINEFRVVITAVSPIQSNDAFFIKVVKNKSMSRFLPSCCRKCTTSQYGSLSWNMITYIEKILCTWLSQQTNLSEVNVQNFPGMNIMVILGYCRWCYSCYKTNKYLNFKKTEGRKRVSVMSSIITVGRLLNVDAKGIVKHFGKCTEFSFLASVWTEPG